MLQMRVLRLSHTPPSPLQLPRKQRSPRRSLNRMPPNQPHVQHGRTNTVTKLEWDLAGQAGRPSTPPPSHVDTQSYFSCPPCVSVSLLYLALDFLQNFPPTTLPPLRQMPTLYAMLTGEGDNHFQTPLMVWKSLHREHLPTQDTPTYPWRALSAITP